MAQTPYTIDELVQQFIAPQNPQQQLSAFHGLIEKAAPLPEVYGSHITFGELYCGLYSQWPPTITVVAAEVEYPFDDCPFGGVA